MEPPYTTFLASQTMSTSGKGGGHCQAVEQYSQGSHQEFYFYLLTYLSFKGYKKGMYHSVPSPVRTHITTLHIPNKPDNAMCILE